MEYLQLTQLLTKKTKEDIIASAYSSPRKEYILIRLSNTKPDRAVVPALISDINVTKPYINVTKQIVEYIPGTSKKTNNRKIDMNTYISTLEDLILALDDPNYIVQPPKLDYELKIMTKEGLVPKSSTGL